MTKICRAVRALAGPRGPGGLAEHASNHQGILRNGRKREEVTRVCLVALLALVVAPSVARTQAAPGGVTIVSRDLRVRGERTLASSPAPARFDMVGFRWRGGGSVLF